MFDVYSVVFALILITTISDSYGDCVLSLNKDFGNPGPVFLQNGEFLAPNSKSGAISLGRSETVTVACPGTKRRIVLNNVTTVHDTVEAHCIINTTFRVERQFVQFKEIKCNMQPYFTTEQTNQKCAGLNHIYAVGYKVKGVLHKLYSACFDQSLLTTRYVEHHLSPTSSFMQTSVKRPNFLEGNMFGGVSMSSLYKTANQKAQLNAILGDKMADVYMDKIQFLTRGHLAARADFTTSAETRATFHYVNCAPQWMRGNAGDWAALEDAVRRRVQARGSKVVVFTGTHGVMTLPDRQGHMQEIYLHTDANNNGIVPVPMYYFKLVYDPTKKTAAAFVTINSSFYNKTVTDELQFCDDICEGNSKYRWLSWRSNDGTHSFCCDYEQFADEVDYLPKIDVRGLFY